MAFVPCLSAHALTASGKAVALRRARPTPRTHAVVAHVTANAGKADAPADVDVLGASSHSQEPSEWRAVRARHIQLETEGMVDACLEQLQQKRATFEELARTLSQCSTASRHGDVGWFTRNMMVPEFEDACFDGEVGSIRKIKSPFGWHLIRVEGKSAESSEISAKEFAARYNDVRQRERMQLIDVREASELAESSLPGFMSLPISEHSELANELEDGRVGLDPDVETVVMCSSGKRANHIVKFLAQQGFSRVRNLVGGLNAYKQLSSPPA